MIFLYLLMASQSQADAVLDRFQSFIAKTPSFRAEIFPEIGGAHPGKATLWVASPSKLAFQITWPQIDYHYIENGGMCTEYEKTRGIYDEYPWFGRLSPPNSRITTISHVTFPEPLVSGNLRVFVAKSAKFGLTGHPVIEGVTCDQVYASYESLAGKGEVTAIVDPAGKLLRFDNLLHTREGDREVRLNIRNYVVGPQPESVFSTLIPDGFAPFALPKPLEPLHFGAKAPTDGWVSARSGNRVDLLHEGGAKPKLLVVVDKESAPSSAAIADLGGTEMPFSLIVLSDGTDASSAPKAPGDVYFDPSGTHLSELSNPGTPMFYLLDKEGKVAWMWYGYVSSQKSEFLVGVGQAIKESSATPK